MLANHESNVMNRNGLALILATTILAFASLYAPQPLLPLLGQELEITPTQAALLMTLALLPLSVAPLAYGFLLETYPAQRLLRAAVFLVMLAELVFTLSSDFRLLATARLLQGLALPALFTSAMTYCAVAAPQQKVRKVIGIYVAGTILGGFLGRAITGLLADYLPWRLPFLLWTGALALVWWRLRLLPSDARAGFSRPHPQVIAAVWREPTFRNAYLGIFSVFFAFASLLNFLPFQLKIIDPLVSETTIALSYVGYLIGVAVALGAPRLLKAMGGVRAALGLGWAVFAAGTALFLVPSVAAIYAAMLIFCAGFFCLHAILSGHLNHLAPSRKGVVNGLYVSSYYAGGALGSLLPGYWYRAYGWGALVGSLLVVIALAGVAIAHIAADLGDD